MITSVRGMSRDVRLTYLSRYVIFILAEINLQTDAIAISCRGRDTHHDSKRSKADIGPPTS